MGSGRRSSYLPHRSAAHLTRAVSFANELGIPLRLFVTINFGLTMMGEDAMSEAFRRLLKSFYGKWISRHPRLTADKRRAAYVWVLEGRPGHHGVHWLVHVPQELQAEFGRELTRWVAATTGGIIDSKAILTKPAYRPSGVADYMLKGLRPHHAKRLGVTPAYQGIVVGKRCGFSESLGPTAIKRHRERATDSDGTVGYPASGRAALNAGATG